MNNIELDRGFSRQWQPSTQLAIEVMPNSGLVQQPLTSRAYYQQIVNLTIECSLSQDRSHNQHRMNLESGDSTSRGVTFDQLKNEKIKLLAALQEQCCPNKEAQKKFWLAIKASNLNLKERSIELKKAIDEGANVNVCSEMGELALNHSITSCELVDVLLQANADPLLKDAMGNNAYFKTIDITQWKKFSAQCGISIQVVAAIKNNEGDTLLFKILRSFSESEYSLNAIKCLFQNGVNVDILNLARDRDGRTLFDHMTIGGEKVEIAKLLIQHGLDVNRFSLSTALLYDNMKFALMLLENGSPITKEVWDRILSVFLTSRPNKNIYSYKIARLILENFDFSQVGWTPLHFATHYGLNEDLPRLLKQNDIGINSKSPELPLVLAARNEQFLSFFLLLEAGADITNTFFFEIKPYTHVYPFYIQLLKIYREELIKPSRLLALQMLLKNECLLIQNARQKWELERDRGPFFHGDRKAAELQAILKLL